MCDASFIYKRDISRHLQSKHKCFKDTRRLARGVCQFCHKVLMGNRALRRHLRVIHSFPKRKKYQEQPATCDDCNRYFKTKTGYVTHHRRFHLKIIQYDRSGFCSICANGKCYSNLGIHMNAHTGNA